ISLLKGLGVQAAVSRSCSTRNGCRKPQAKEPTLRRTEGQPMQQPESSRTFNAVRWTVLTTAGLAGGLIAGLLVGMPLGRLVNAMIVTASVTCVVGGVLGSFQAAGLRRLLTKPLWWIAATIVGLGIGLALGVATVEQAGILLTGNRDRIAQ